MPRPYLSEDQRIRHHLAIRDCPNMNTRANRWDTCEGHFRQLFTIFATMATGRLFRILQRLGLAPGTRKMAGLARKPTGFFGRQVAGVMNQSNAVLYDFVISLMHLRDDENVLEIGFGNGRTFDKLFESQPAIKASGLDLSQTMVREAVRYNRKRIDQGKLKLHCGSSDEMPFPGGTFDKVYCINVMYFWDDTDAHLREVLRVLKPGGTFYPVIRTKESLQLVPFTKYGFLLKEENEWVSLLTRAGFSNVTVQRLDEPRLDFDGKEILMKSLCLVSRKPG